MCGNYIDRDYKTKDFKHLPIEYNSKNPLVRFLKHWITRNNLEKARKVIIAANKFLKLSLKISPSLKLQGS